ncbi:MAG: hypothetical protein ABSG65_20305 [Bryobacteraceae bacterium]
MHSVVQSGDTAQPTAEQPNYFHLDFVVKELDGGNVVSARHIDAGVNIDCRSTREIQGDLALSVTAEISTTVTLVKQPLIRQTKWSSNVVVPIGSPTVIFSSDDVTGKGRCNWN